MSLEVKRDLWGKTYAEGDVNGNHVIVENDRDWLGNKYGKVKVNGTDEYHVERACDPFTGETHYPVTKVRGASYEPSGSGGGVIAVLLVIILLPAAVYIPLLIWKWLVGENIPELTVISIGSVGIAAFMIFRSKAGFMEALECAVPLISFLFFLMASLLSFVIPTPAMATRFSIGALLGIGLIGFIASLAPSLIIAILSGIINRFRK